jgi:hypothetical protein
LFGAVCLKRGTVGLRDFTAEALGDADARSRPQLPAADFESSPELAAGDGARLSHL